MTSEQEFAGITFYGYEGIMTIVYGQNVQRFTPTEAAVLATFALHHDRVCTRTMLYEALYWDKGEQGPDPKIIDVIVTKLRKKFRNYNLPIELKTFWGRGYMLQAKSVQDDSRPT